MLAQGFHNTTREQYDKLDAMNYSKLKYLADCAARFRHECDNPRETTDALDFGNAFDLAMFEPLRFASEVVKARKINRQSNAGKAEYAAYVDENAGRLLIDADDYDTIEPMSKALWNHPAASKYLALPGTLQHTAVWLDPGAQILCKGRFDCYKPDHQIILDVKTTKNSKPWLFRSDVSAFGYDVQAAMYTMAAEIITGKPHRFLWLVVEKKPPFIPAVFELDRGTMDAAQQKVRNLLAKYATCSTFDQWPGYSDDVIEIGLPDYTMEVSE